MDLQSLTNVVYLIAAILFILDLKMLAHPAGRRVDGRKRLAARRLAPFPVDQHPRLADLWHFSC